MKKVLKYTSIFSTVIILVFLILVFFPLSNITFEEKDYTQILIEDVNIVDIENEKIDSSKYILIAGNKIKRISSSPINFSDQQTLRINGKNKFVIPALWDMHVHLNRHFPLNIGAEFIVNGVMHVRDMRGAYNSRDPFATTPERIRNWTKLIRENKLIAPVIHNTPSLAIEGPHEMFDNSPYFFNCSNPQEARLLVDYLEENKVDFIKTYNNIPRDAFFEIMKQAKIKNISVGGHKPLKISTREALEAGMKSLEHSKFLIWDSYVFADSIRKIENPGSLDNTDFRYEILTNQDTSKLNEILTVFRKSDSYYCPTHLTRKADAYADRIDFRANYDSINSILRFLSFEDLDATIKEDPTVLGRKVYMDFYKKSLEITKLANKQGVILIAGSDVPELPGNSLIKELKEFSNAGLSNYEVLKTATINPVTYFNLQNEYGTIAEGKIADILILENNPTINISAIEGINSLIYNGFYLSDEKLDKLERKLYERNNGYVMTAKLIWDIIIFSTL